MHACRDEFLLYYIVPHIGSTQFGYSSGRTELNDTTDIVAQVAWHAFLLGDGEIEKSQYKCIKSYWNLLPSNNRFGLLSESIHHLPYALKLWYARQPSKYTVRNRGAHSTLLSIYIFRRHVYVCNRWKMVELGCPLAHAPCNMCTEELCGWNG